MWILRLHNTAFPPNAEDCQETHLATPGATCVWEIRDDIEDQGSIPQKYILHDTVQDCFVCGMCSRVMAEPVRVVPCGHTFCNDCIKSLRPTMELKCLDCCCDKPSEAFVSVPELKQQIRESVKIRCPAGGCHDTFPIKHLPDHLRTECKHSRLACVAKDSHGQQCGSVVVGSERKAHEANCLFATVPCQYEGCDARPVRREAWSHMSACGYRRLICLCGVSVRIKSKASHSEVCPEAEVECVGCSGRMPRRAMKTHLAEVDYHLTELKDKWDALQGDLKAELSKPCKDPMLPLPHEGADVVEIAVVEPLDVQWKADLTQARVRETNGLYSLMGPALECGGWPLDWAFQESEGRRGEGAHAGAADSPAGRTFDLWVWGHRGAGESGYVLPEDWALAELRATLELWKGSFPYASKVFEGDAVLFPTPLHVRDVATFTGDAGPTVYARVVVKSVKAVLRPLVLGQQAAAVQMG